MATENVDSTKQGSCILINGATATSMVGFASSCPDEVLEALKSALRPVLATLIEDARLETLKKPRKKQGKYPAVPVDFVPQSGTPFLTEAQVETLCRKRRLDPSLDVKAQVVHEVLRFMSTPVFKESFANCLKPALSKHDSTSALSAALDRCLKMEAKGHA